MKLRDYRKAACISQHDLAEKTGLTQCYISRLEKDRKPSVKVAKKIAEVLGIDWWLLFENK